MMGGPADEDVSDAALIRAVRKRLIGELGAGHEGHHAHSAAQKIINNIYGGGSPQSGGSSEGGGVGGHMGGTGAIDPGLYDYYVDINREDLPDVNPATGKPAGWKKSVHRYRTPKGEGDSHEGKKKA